MWQDSHVWVPHGCAFESVTRPAAKQCLTKLDGIMLLFGDSEMRGVFCDLDNWLRREVTKGNLPPYRLDNRDSKRMGMSTWDEMVCGFNGNLGKPNKNSACGQGKRVESFLPESRVAKVVSLAPCSKYNREFTLQLNSHTEVGDVAYIETIGLGRTVVRVQEVARAGFRTVNGTAVSAIGIHSCLWDLRAKQGATSIHKMWDQIGHALRHFEGTVFLLGCPPLHNIEGTSIMKSEVVRGIQSAHYRLAANHSSTRWHVFDLMATGMARPERSLDATHMYARKCTGSPGWQNRVCSKGSRDINGCCLPADAFPFSVSFTWVQMMLHLLCAQR